MNRHIHTLQPNALVWLWVLHYNNIIYITYEASALYPQVFFYKGIWEPCPSPVFILSAGVFAGVISNDPGFFAPTFQLVVRA